VMDQLILKTPQTAMAQIVQSLVTHNAQCH